MLASLVFVVSSGHKGVRSSARADRLVHRPALRRPARADIRPKRRVTLEVCEGPKRPSVGSEPDRLLIAPASVFAETAPFGFSCSALEIASLLCTIGGQPICLGLCSEPVMLLGRQAHISRKASGIAAPFATEKTS